MDHRDFDRRYEVMTRGKGGRGLAEGAWPNGPFSPLGETLQFYEERRKYITQRLRHIDTLRPPGLSYGMPY